MSWLGWAFGYGGGDKEKDGNNDKDKNQQNDKSTPTSTSAKSKRKTKKEKDESDDEQEEETRVVKDDGDGQTVRVRRGRGGRGNSDDDGPLHKSNSRGADANPKELQNMEMMHNPPDPAITSGGTDKHDAKENSETRTDTARRRLPQQNWEDDSKEQRNRDDREDVEESQVMDEKAIRRDISNMARQRLAEVHGDNDEVMTSGSLNHSELVTLEKLMRWAFTSDRQLADASGREDMREAARAMQTAFSNSENLIQFSRDRKTALIVTAILAFKAKRKEIEALNASGSLKSRLDTAALVVVETAGNVIKCLNNSLKHQTGVAASALSGAVHGTATVDVNNILSTKGAAEAAASIAAATASAAAVNAVKNYIPGAAAASDAVAEAAQNALKATKEDRNRVGAAQAVHSALDAAEARITATVGNGAVVSVLMNQLKSSRMPNVAEQVRQCNMNLNEKKAKVYTKQTRPSDDQILAQLRSMSSSANEFMSWAQATHYSATALMGEESGNPDMADSMPSSARPTTLTHKLTQSGLAAGLTAAAGDMEAAQGLMTRARQWWSGVDTESQRAIRDASVRDAQIAIDSLLNGVESGSLKVSDISVEQLNFANSVYYHGMANAQGQSREYERLTNTSSLARTLRTVLPNTWGSWWSGIDYSHAAVALGASALQQLSPTIRSVAYELLKMGVVTKDNGYWFTAVAGANQNLDELATSVVMTQLASWSLMLASAAWSKWSSSVRSEWSHMPALMAITDKRPEFVSRYIVEPCMYYNMARVILSWINTVNRTALNVMPVRIGVVSQMVILRGHWVRVADAAIRLHVSAMGREYACSPAILQPRRAGANADNARVAQEEEKTKLIRGYTEARLYCLKVIAEAVKATRSIWLQLGVSCQGYYGWEEFKASTEAIVNGERRKSTRVSADKDEIVNETLLGVEQTQRELLNMFERASESTDAKSIHDGSDSDEDLEFVLKPQDEPTVVGMREPANPYAYGEDAVTDGNEELRLKKHWKPKRKFKRDAARGAASLSYLLTVEESAHKSGCWISMDLYEYQAGLRIIDAVVSFMSHVHRLFDLPQYKNVDAPPSWVPGETTPVDDLVVTATLLLDCLTMTAAMNTVLVTPAMMTSVVSQVVPDMKSDMADDAVFRLSSIEALADRATPLRRGQLFVSAYKLMIYTHERQFGIVGSRIIDGFECEYDRRRTLRLSAVCAISGFVDHGANNDTYEMLDVWRHHAGDAIELWRHALGWYRGWLNKISKTPVYNIELIPTAVRERIKETTTWNPNTWEIFVNRNPYSLLAKPQGVAVYNDRKHVESTSAANAGYNIRGRYEWGRTTNWEYDRVTCLFPLYRRRWTWDDMHWFGSRVGRCVMRNTYRDAEAYLQRSERLADMMSATHDGYAVRRELSMPAAEQKDEDTQTYEQKPHDVVLEFDTTAAEKLLEEIKEVSFEYKHELNLADPYMGFSDNVVQRLHNYQEPRQRDVFAHRPELTDTLRQLLPHEDPFTHMFYDMAPSAACWDWKTATKWTHHPTKFVDLPRLLVEDLGAIVKCARRFYGRRHADWEPQCKEYGLLCARFISNVMRLLVWALFEMAPTPPDISALFLARIRMMCERVADTLKTGSDREISRLFPLHALDPELWLETRKLTSLHQFRNNALLEVVWRAASLSTPIERRARSAANRIAKSMDISIDKDSPAPDPQLRWGPDWLDLKREKDLGNAKSAPMDIPVAVELFTEVLALRPMTVVPLNGDAQCKARHALLANTFLKLKKFVTLAPIVTGVHSSIAECYMRRCPKDVYIHELRRFCAPARARAVAEDTKIDGVHNLDYLLSMTLKADTLRDKSAGLYSFYGADVVFQYVLRRLYIQKLDTSYLSYESVHTAAFRFIRDKFTVPDRKVGSILDSLRIPLHHAHVLSIDYKHPDANMVEAARNAVYQEYVADNKDLQLVWNKWCPRKDRGAVLDRDSFKKYLTGEDELKITSGMANYDRYTANGKVKERLAKITADAEFFRILITYPRDVTAANMYLWVCYLNHKDPSMLKTGSYKDLYASIEAFFQNKLYLEKNVPANLRKAKDDLGHKKLTVPKPRRSGNLSAQNSPRGTGPILPLSKTPRRGRSAAASGTTTPPPLESSGSDSSDNGSSSDEEDEQDSDAKDNRKGKGKGKGKVKKEESGDESESAADTVPSDDEASETEVHDGDSSDTAEDSDATVAYPGFYEEDAEYDNGALHEDYKHATKTKVPNIAVAALNGQRSRRNSTSAPQVKTELEDVEITVIDENGTETKVRVTKATAGQARDLINNWKKREENERTELDPGCRSYYQVFSQKLKFLREQDRVTTVFARAAGGLSKTAQRSPEGFSDDEQKKVKGATQTLEFATWVRESWCVGKYAITPELLVAAWYNYRFYEYNGIKAETDTSVYRAYVNLSLSQVVAKFRLAVQVYVQVLIAESESKNVLHREEWPSDCMFTEKYEYKGAKFDPRKDSDVPDCREAMRRLRNKYIRDHPNETFDMEVVKSATPRPSDPLGLHSPLPSARKSKSKSKRASRTRKGDYASVTDVVLAGMLQPGNARVPSGSSTLADTVVQSTKTEMLAAIGLTKKDQYYRSPQAVLRALASVFYQFNSSSAMKAEYRFNCDAVGGPPTVTLQKTYVFPNLEYRAGSAEIQLDGARPSPKYEWVTPTALQMYRPGTRGNGNRIMCELTTQAVIPVVIVNGEGLREFNALFGTTDDSKTMTTFARHLYNKKGKDGRYHFIVYWRRDTGSGATLTNAFNSDLYKPFIDVHSREFDLNSSKAHKRLKFVLRLCEHASALATYAFMYQDFTKIDSYMEKATSCKDATTLKERVLALQKLHDKQVEPFVNKDMRKSKTTNFLFGLGYYDE